MTITEACFSPDGRFIAVVYQDLGINTLDMEMKVVREVAALTDFEPAFIHVSPDSQLILMGLSDLTMGIWDIETGQKLYAVDCDHQPPVGAFFLRDGNQVIAATDRRLFWWNFKTGQIVKEILMPFEGIGGIYSFQLSRDEQSVIIGHLWGRVKQLELATGRLLHNIPPIGQVFTDACISLDGKWIAVCEQVVQIYETLTGQLVKTLKPDHKPVVSRFSPDSSVLWVSDGDTLEIQIWDWKEASLLKTCGGHIGTVWSLEWSPDGKHVITAGWDGRVILRDANTGDEIGRHGVR